MAVDLWCLWQLWKRKQNSQPGKFFIIIAIESALVLTKFLRFVQSGGTRKLDFTQVWWLLRQVKEEEPAKRWQFLKGLSVSSKHTTHRDTVYPVWWQVTEQPKWNTSWKTVLTGALVASDVEETVEGNNVNKSVCSTPVARHSVSAKAVLFLPAFLIQLSMKGNFPLEGSVPGKIGTFPCYFCSGR